ncbi:MAG: hypothetical protein WAV52_08445, partial [Luteococcus japonicus]
MAEEAQVEGLLGQAARHTGVSDEEYPLTTRRGAGWRCSTSTRRSWRTVSMASHASTARWARILPVAGSSSCSRHVVGRP